ncbi:MAG: cytochrome d ubiquinol oxidase subunit II [Alistipes sp.]|nr:cytochrome d ubiquinol oxidase subunit II [Alistipes sp.]
MDTLILLQHYWWAVIALLASLLVFLLFVQGGQGMLYELGRTAAERTMIVNSTGRKWELTFTTLVTFGGAFFAAFPLFYSTSFGGAFYVWMLILLVMVIQAVAYEFRRKPNNIFGERFYNILLVINGIGAPLLIGTAVGTMFTGAEFTVNRANLSIIGGESTISQWVSPWYGLEALADMRNVCLGLALVFLSRMLAAQYFMNDIDDRTLFGRSRKAMLINAVPFVIFFVAFLLSILVADGWAVGADGIITIEPYKYLHNMLAMPVVTALLLAGVVSVLASVVLGYFRSSRKAIWFGGIGTVVTVWMLLLTLGFNGTAYYPSLVDAQSSLTIQNSSSGLFTLKTMTIVSALVPFVLTYIWYVWREVNKHKISQQTANDDHAY